MSIAPAHQQPELTRPVPSLYWTRRPWYERRGHSWIERRAYENLHRLWLAMAPPAESFDRQSDSEAKARIYALIDAVEDARRQVA